MIFQEPMTSLNPVYTIGDQIAEAVVLHQHVNQEQAYKIAEDALHDVGIADPRRRLGEYPHQMSGGMRQRVMIAMALSCKPKLLIADEPTTALDVTIQAQILELLRKLQRDRGMSILLITHDLGVVAENADVVAVMYASRIVEVATVEDLFDRPQHPYTEGLFRSNSETGAMPKIGWRPSPAKSPTPRVSPRAASSTRRCPRTRALAAASKGQDVVTIHTGEEKAAVMRVCVQDEPMLREVLPKHWAACHFAENFAAAQQTSPQLEHQREVVPEVVEVDSGVQNTRVVMQ